MIAADESLLGFGTAAAAGRLQVGLGQVHCLVGLAGAAGWEASVSSIFFSAILADLAGFGSWRAAGRFLIVGGSVSGSDS